MNTTIHYYRATKMKLSDVKSGIYISSDIWGYLGHFPDPSLKSRKNYSKNFPKLKKQKKTTLKRFIHFLKKKCFLYFWMKS